MADLNINIVSDVVCPWCYIGKRRLERALELRRAQQPDVAAPQVTWRPFQLNPGLPAAGIARDEYLARKFGTAHARQIYARVTAVGREVGIPFAFDRIVRQPNTLAAHSLIRLARTHGVQDAVVEALFRAYFVDAADLTDSSQLCDIVAAAGLERDAAVRCLAGDAARREVAAEDSQARARGIECVPFFIFNGSHAVSGAQDPQVLLDAMSAAQAPAAEPQHP
jgi:predicted DsbA family dithiol-disulfide isomerase